MNILAICGSPRKGNCYAVLNLIKQSYAEHNVNILMIGDLHLDMCRGCYSCIFNGEETCPLKDDRDMIIKKIYAADAVIFASPVYVNQLSALMKKMIERLAFNGHRPKFHDKFAMVLSVCKAFGAKHANQYMQDVFSSFGFNVVSTLELQASTNSIKEKLMNNKKTLQTFESFVSKAMEGRQTPPTIMNLVMFNMFKYVSEVYPEQFKADHQYYQEIDKYPYDGRINYFKNLIAKRKVNNFKKEFELNRV